MSTIQFNYKWIVINFNRLSKFLIIIIIINIFNYLLRFQNVTSTSLVCQLNKPEVNYFNSSMLVNNDFGRSITSSNLFYVSPDQNLYNFQTYAGIIFSILIISSLFNYLCNKIAQITAIKRQERFYLFLNV